MTQPTPLQIDSTEPNVIAMALDQIPGRVIVNSINLETGRDKLDNVVPTAVQHGAALIALTIDEVGMAKTADRKVEIAQRLKQLCCDEHGLDPELLIFDALTFTLTTGDEDWRPWRSKRLEGSAGSRPRFPASKPRSAFPTFRSAYRQPKPHHAVRRDLRAGTQTGRRPCLQPQRTGAGALH